MNSYKHYLNIALLTLPLAVYAEGTPGQTLDEKLLKELAAFSQPALSKAPHQKELEEAKEMIAPPTLKPVELIVDPEAELTLLEPPLGSDAALIKKMRNFATLVNHPEPRRSADSSINEEMLKLKKLLKSSP